MSELQFINYLAINILELVGIKTPSQAQINIVEAALMQVLLLAQTERSGEC